MDAATLEKLQPIREKFLAEQGTAISVLQDIQEAFGYIPEEIVFWIAEKCAIPASRLFGVVTFYSQFYTKPRGRNIVTACCGTVCHVKGSHRILFQLNEELTFAPGENTTRDGLITVEKVACLGACSIAPVVVINSKVHGRMSPDRIVKKIKALKEKSSE